MREVRREAGRPDAAPARRMDRHPRDRILQLAHIARPVVPRECGERVGRQRRVRADTRRGVGPEVCREHRNIAGPFAQGRDVDADDVEAEAEIRAEPSGRSFLLEPPVGGRHDPDVDPPRHVLADPPDLAVLEHTQQLGLRARRQFTDLVEE